MYLKANIRNNYQITAGSYSLQLWFKYPFSPHTALSRTPICFQVDASRLTSPLTWRHHGLREARPGHRSNRVAVDVVLASLDGQGVGQPEQAQLGRAVVGLAEVPVDACGRSCHDDSDQKTAEETSRSTRRRLHVHKGENISAEVTGGQRWPELPSCLLYKRLPQV